ncbi:hypothetical protein NLG97_g10855 [Lecanicillium saksenae]|uniref:Uncharacterized protein n=1 Tax=Lecanicillium saksenae TaxID=468837 RepID=A0ACC1QFV4_9HYPO|nr:hypothetical protein NLG97_g10855 [Lecanicillium saksenae]
MSSSSGRRSFLSALCSTSTAVRNRFSDIRASSWSGTARRSSSSLSVCSRSSYDSDVSDSFLSSGSVEQRLDVALASDSLRARTRRCEPWMLLWILWNVPIDELKPWWCSCTVFFSESCR